MTTNYQKIFDSVTHPNFDSVLDYVDLGLRCVSPSVKNIVDWFPSYARDCLISGIENDIGHKVSIEEIIEVFDDIGWRWDDRKAWAYETEDDLIRAIDDAIHEHLNELSGVD